LKLYKQLSQVAKFRKIAKSLFAKFRNQKDKHNYWESVKTCEEQDEWQSIKGVGYERNE